MASKVLLVVASLLLFAAAAPVGEAADPLPEPQCMPVYQEYDLGAVRIVRPNSCTTHVWVLGQQIL
jgi:hypothetical protein